MYLPIYVSNKKLPYHTIVLPVEEHSPKHLNTKYLCAKKRKYQSTTTTYQPIKLPKYHIWLETTCGTHSHLHLITASTQPSQRSKVTSTHKWCSKCSPQVHWSSCIALCWSLSGGSKKVNTWTRARRRCCRRQTPILLSPYFPSTTPFGILGHTLC